ncbi:MAG: MATE family efflux transporter [Alphaproteobacteria bacterium]
MTTEQIEAVTYKRIFLLSTPIVISNFAVPLLGMVDTAVIGNTQNAAAIGAVAIGAMIFSFVFFLFDFLSMVTSGLSAQAYGRSFKQPSQMRELSLILARGFVFALLLAGLILLLQQPFMNLALWWFDLSPEMERQTTSYFQIRIWAAPVTLSTFVVLGWLIGLQRTGLVMILMLFTQTTNILLDFLFVLHFDMGIQGVAYASLIAEYSAFGLGIFMVYRAIPHKFKGLMSELKLADFISLMSANMDLFIRNLCIEASFMTIAKLGLKISDVVVAANAILMHLFLAMAYATDGFAQAAESLTGEALGRKNKTTYKQAFVKTLVFSIFVATLFSLFYFLLGSWLAGLFTQIEGVLQVVEEHLVWVVLIPLTSIVSMHFDGVFVGATRSREMRNAMLVALAGFLVLVFPLYNQFGNHGIWAAINVFMLLRGLCLGWYLPRMFADSNFKQY